MKTTDTSTQTRQLTALRRVLGRTVLDALDDPTVFEVFANPDGGVWVDRVGEGMTQTGVIKPEDAEAVIRLVAHHMGETADSGRPLVSGTLPGTGERFQGTLPPVVTAPYFSVRKPPPVVFGLDDYVTKGSMTLEQCNVIRATVAARRNIMISGGTGTGKTTLANAVLAEPAFVKDRVVILEDTRELQCSSKNQVRMLTKKDNPEVTLTQLVRESLRMRPDRIIIGEIRGGEALDMVQALNTGHTGSVSTVHANSAGHALSRVEDLVGQVSANIPHHSIASALDLVVHLERCPEGRRVASMCRVEGYNRRDGYRMVDL
jgi:type IV secretion system protein VirB11